MKDPGTDVLSKICNWPSEVALVPCSGIQVLDFGFDFAEISSRKLSFVERTVGALDGGNIRRQLITLSGDEEVDEQQLGGGVRDDDDQYTIDATRALEPFLNKWMPVPVLRRGVGKSGVVPEAEFDQGPTTWARMRVTELDQPVPVERSARDDDSTAKQYTHHVQLALDTSLVERTDESGIYLAPTRADAEGRREFQFRSAPQETTWFFQNPQTLDDQTTVDVQEWVSDWCYELFLSCMQAQRPTFKMDRDDYPKRLEHWARYLTYLAAVDAAVSSFPLLRFADTVSKTNAVKPVEVDFVLDIGNSRSCGLLIESFPDDRGRNDLSRSYPLRVRDLSMPERSYSGLFDSRVEFAHAQFGDERLARKSRREQAFLWPSMVRFGPEAQRLVGEQDGTETTSGLSSPKRYLWDRDQVPQDWRFHGHHDRTSHPRVAYAAMRKLNDAGDVISQVKADEKNRLRQKPKDDSNKEPTFHPRFSNSALFGFLLQEIFSHALVQINDPASRIGRKQEVLPRRLRRIVLTLPTATTMQERAIIRSRAEGALQLLWDMQGENEIATTTWNPEKPPEIIVEWDEASCSQLVYLYSEIAQRYDGQINQYLELRGRLRPGGPDGDKPAPSLRVACVDIGGGTMDLMITTYYGEDDSVLHPVQNFREGFRVAGDDLVRNVISNILLPKLLESIEDSIKAGGGQPRGVRERIAALFAAAVGGQDQRQIQLRRLYSLQVLTPLAVALLSSAEDVGEFDQISVAAAEVLTAGAVADEDSSNEEDESVAPTLVVPSRIQAYLEDAIRECGASDWHLADFRMSVPRHELDRHVQDMFRAALENLTQVVGHLDCDVVLLTGRPSRLAAVRSIIEEQLAVLPSQLISLHDYRAGDWYPYRDQVTNRIGDPKTTVAVGAMLMALADSRLSDFALRTERIRMKSTARFIGEMGKNGMITEAKVLFDLENGSAAGDQEKPVKLYNPMYLGFRQLPLEGWTTTPLYELDFASHEIAQKHRTPFTIALIRRRSDDTDDADDALGLLRREASVEELVVDSVETSDQTPLKPQEVKLRLQTIGRDDKYWIDTGEFNFN